MIVQFMVNAASTQVMVMLRAWYTTFVFMGCCNLCIVSRRWGTQCQSRLMRQLMTPLLQYARCVFHELLQVIGTACAVYLA